MEFKFTNPNDAYIYDTISDAIEDKTKELLSMLFEKVYQKGREDLANELKPKTVVKYGIFTRNREKGIEQIKKLVGDKPIIIEKYGRNECVVKCIDSEYRILSFSQNSRGCKMHYAYVDSALLDDSPSFEILKCVVEPCLTPAYYLYKDGEKRDLDNHLLYF